MKSTVEQLSPTRVRINVEVPFAELKSDFDKAYKALAQQIRLPGSAPARLRPDSSKRVSVAAQCSSRLSTTLCRRVTPRLSPAPA